MAREKYILVSHYIQNSNIEDAFVQHLQEFGLITFVEKQNNYFINENDINEIERMFRLHKDLGINLEGLDAIKQLLKRLRRMEKDMELLQKRLRLYE